MWELLAGDRTAVLPRHARRRRIRRYPDLCASKFNKVFSLTWPASMQIYWNKRKRLHKKRVQLPQDWFGTQTWLPFHCFGTQIWPPRRHVKTHNKTNLKQGAHIHQPTASSTSRMRTTCVFFCVLLSGGFSRLPQRESLLTGYIHSIYAHNRNFSRWKESAGNLVEYLITWPLLMKLRTWVSNVCPRQSEISSLSNLWATESMHMILTAIDCERTGNRWLLQSW